MSTQEYTLNLSLRDTCEFYKHKLDRLQEKYNIIWKLLDKVSATHKESNEMHACLVTVTEELSQTQQQLSEMQVFLFQEREENLRLSADNDALKIDIMSLNPTTNGANGESNRIFASDNLRSSSRIGDAVTSNNLYYDDHKRIPINKEDSLPTFALQLSENAMLCEIVSLTTQLSNLQTLHRNEVEVLLKDREVAAQERIVEVGRLNKHISHLMQALSNTQDNLRDVMKRFLLEHENFEREFEHWRDEKRMLEEQIISKGNKERGHSTNLPRMLTEKVLYERLESQEKLTTAYKQQCKLLQKEQNKWKEQALKSEKNCRDKIQQLTLDLASMKKRFEVLDKRRLLEAEGFRTDIKMMRTRIKEISNNIIKLKSDASIAINNHDEEPEDNHDVKISTENVLYTAIMLENEVKLLKKKFAHIVANGT